MRKTDANGAVGNVEETVVESALRHAKACCEIAFVAFLGNGFSRPSIWVEGVQEVASLLIRSQAIYAEHPGHAFRDSARAASV